MNIFISDMYRLIKEKSFYVLAALIVVFSVLKCIVINALISDGATYILGDAVLQSIGLDLLGTLAGIGISLFNGKEYSNNTIRNKICCGESRYKVLTVKFIKNYLIALVFFLIAFITTLICGAIMFEHTFGEEFWAKFFCQLLLLLGFTSVISCVVNTTKSLKISLILTVALFVFLNAFSYMLPQFGDNAMIAVACRSIYMVVSTMLMSAENGVYEIMSKSFVNGQVVSNTITFANLYLNCALVFIIYTAISISVSVFVVRKQNYK